MTLIKATVALALIATPVTAQQNRNCAPRETVVERLASAYGEYRQSVGLSEAGMIETFASSDTGTWTITRTMPNMITCLIASGQAWEELAEVAPPKGTEGLRRR